MAIYVVSSTITTNTNPSTYHSDEITFTRPVDIENGDMLVTVIGLIGTQGWVRAAGSGPPWVDILNPDKGSPDRQIRVLYRIVTNAGGEPYSYKFDVTEVCLAQGIMLCLRGADITTPTFIQGAQGDDDPVGSNLQCPSVTSTFDEAFILSCVMICDTSGSPGDLLYEDISGTPSLTRVMDGVPTMTGTAQLPESGSDHRYVKVGVAYARQDVAGQAGPYGWAVPDVQGNPDELRDGAELAIAVAIRSIIGYSEEDVEPEEPIKYKNIPVLFEGEYYPFNYNPVHAIWQCLIKVGLPETWLNDASFLAAAITVYAEGTGVAVLLRQHQSCLVYLKSLLAHINGILYYGTDGTLHIKLVRDDYTVGTLPTVGIEELLGEPDFERGSWLETIGEVQIQFNQITAPEI